MKHLVTFTPKICQSEPDKLSHYTGTVTLLMPSYDERLSFYDDLPEIKKDASDGDKEKRGWLMMRQVARLAGPFVVEVAIKREIDGYMLSSYDDLTYDSDMADVVTEIAGRLLGKYSVGNAPSPT